MRLLGAALAFLLLAGCFGRDAPAATDEIGTTGAEGAGPVVPPDGREGSIIAFNETNATEEGAGGLDHAHDLWQGRDRVTILDGRFGGGSPWIDETVAVALPVPTGALVYEGASTVEVLLHDPERRACSNLWIGGDNVCTDDASSVPDATGGIPGRLEYRDGMTDEWKDAGAITWGTPIKIAIEDPRQTDMPHATYTLWGFRAVFDREGDTMAFSATIDAVRDGSRPIPTWPGHPEFYADTHVREVLRTQHKTSESGVTTLVDPSQASPEMAHPEKLVSYGTRAVHVFVNITGVQTPNPAATPSEWRLGYHNASGIWLDAGIWHPGDQTALAWSIPVDDAGMDGPYSPRSRWGFAIAAVFIVGAPAGPSVVCFGICAEYEVTYDLTVLATDLALPVSEAEK